MSDSGEEQGRSINGSGIGGERSEEKRVEEAQQSRYERSAERISALCARLERARRADYSGLSRDQLLDVWIDAEELMSWVMAKRLEAMHELQRRRAG